MSQQSIEKENRELKRALRLMASKADRNDAILKSFFEIELRLLRCAKLSELLDLILVDFKEFFRLSAVNLILLDPEHAARDLLEEYSPPVTGPNCLRFVSSQRLLNDLYPKKLSVKGQLPEEYNKLAFPNNDNIASAVLLPLFWEDCIIGSLHLGSADADRYSGNLKYDYVEHLASVISSCIENCICRENLQRLSSIDMLTKVFNRRTFEQEIIKELSRASRNHQPISCLFLDLDYFKQVNDNFGHQAGDIVLRGTGQFLKQQLRKTDIVARYGGEEFAILLPNCDQAKALKVAENLRKNFEQSKHSHSE